MQLMRIYWLLAILLEIQCSKALETETTSKEVLAQVEANLMSLFGFKKRPGKVDRSKVVIPQALLDLYEKQTGKPLNSVNIRKPGLLTKSANTVRSFNHVESPVDFRFPGHHRFRLKFNITGIPKNEVLKAAELTLNRDTIVWLSLDERTAIEHYQQVLIHDIVKPGIRGKREVITRVLDSKLVDTRKEGSLSFNVNQAVLRWLENPKENHGILVQVLGQGKNKTTPSRHIRLKRDVFEDEVTWSKKQPLLFTYTDDGRYKQVTGTALMQKRLRRGTHRRGRRKMLSCRRHPMYVDFESVGWRDWIVAPQGYEAYFCAGECNYPFAEHMNTTNHAIVQALINSADPKRNVPKPCCVPTQLSAISMLYVEDNKAILKNYNEMAVVGCGCR